MGNDFKSNLPHYIDGLIESYHETPISEKTTLNLPDKDEVIEIINDFEMLLFRSIRATRRWMRRLKNISSAI